jgi:hypothetical protein
MTAKYQRRTGVGEQVVGDERMLLDEAANRVHVLNGTAAFIWDHLQSPVTVEEIEGQMAGEYDMAKAPDARASIQRVLDDLLEKGLIRGA